ncbi:hypothetical protein K492DRAFT_192318 [Lichtheimia hyalospora FSU 10163]|nr:hypothetical protein K492DRAFT_192318 [Lichtheimia hyalospora FSU 10163]
MARCKKCPNECYHELRHQRKTTLRYNVLGGWSKSVTRHADGQFHCLCRHFHCHRPNEIRDHAKTCRGVPEELQPISRRSERIASRGAPYPPRTSSSRHPSFQRQQQSGIAPPEASGSSSSQQGTETCQTKDSESSLSQQQAATESPQTQVSGPIPPPQQQTETRHTEASGSVSSQQQEATESSQSQTSGSSSSQYEEVTETSQARANELGTTSHIPIPPPPEAALSHDGVGESSSQASYNTAYQDIPDIVPTPPLQSPPPQVPPLTEEAQAEVAHIREMLVQLITSGYHTVETLPEEDFMVTFDVRLAGIRTSALRGTLDITRHGTDVDILARMIYSIMDGVPGGTLQNLRIHYYPSHCLIL